MDVIQRNYLLLKRRFKPFSLGCPPSQSAGNDPADDNLESPVWINTTILVHACLLAKDWRSAHHIAAKEQVLGWSSSDNSQGVGVTFFLVLLSGKPSGALLGNLAQLWQQRLADSSGFGYSGESS